MSDICPIEWGLLTGTALSASWNTPKGSLTAWHLVGPQQALGEWMKCSFPRYILGLTRSKPSPRVVWMGPTWCPGLLASVTGTLTAGPVLTCSRLSLLSTPEVWTPEPSLRVPFGLLLLQWTDAANSCCFLRFLRNDSCLPIALGQDRVL